VRLARLTVNTDLEVGFQPLGKISDEFFAEVAAMARPGLLEGMIQVLAWNLGNVDGISAKIEELVGDQGIAAFLGDVVFCVDSVSDISSAILGQRYDLIDMHGINQLAMPGALAEIDPTRSHNPITLFGQFNNVASD
jgi:hypothetical protein